MINIGEKHQLLSLSLAFELFPASYSVIERKMYKYFYEQVIVVSEVMENNLGKYVKIKEDKGEYNWYLKWFVGEDLPF